MAGETIGPYRLLHRLGTGGMGEVFLAEDPRLGRRVAIKRAFDTPSTPDSRERLRREAFAAAQLNHPNVAAVHDVLDVDDIPHIVMEYVEGETLGTLVRRGPVPAEQALSIARQITDALAEAHAHAVIHRDLKPANVMVTSSGRVKVLDFGIAREPAQAAAVAGPAKPTQVYGTPEYMAPEQFMGARGDARSDIYSFGALLFELLTGQPPFQRTDHMQRFLNGAAQSPPDPRTVNPAIPQALSDVVVRALAFKPDQRFQTIDLFRNALERAAGAISEAPTTAVGMPIPLPRRLLLRRWLIGLAGVITVVSVAVLQPWRRPAGGTGSPRVVAVLPFDVPPGEKELEGLGTGLAELIVNGLAASHTLTAVPRSAALGYDKNAAVGPDAERIARELGANHLIDGALRRTPAGVDLTVRIGRLDPGDAWQRSYSSTLDDVLSLGRRILNDVVVQLGAEAATPSQTSATSLEAFQQYAQARGLIDRRDIPGNIDRAIELLDAAIKREPAFALAHAALGEACWEKYRQTLDRSWVDRGEQEILLALSSDANQPLIRYSLATILYGTGHSDRAEQELRTIVQTHPVDSAHRLLGRILTERGQIDEAMKELQHAIDVRPGYWANYAAMGTAALKAGRYADAERSFLRVTDLQPDNADAYANLGIVYLLTNQRDRAIEQLRRSIRLAPTVSAWSNLGNALTDARRHDEAVEAFRQAVALRPRDPLLQRNLGDSLVHLGRTREAQTVYAEGVRVAREALAVNPKSADSHGALAICLAKVGEFDQALQHVTEAATIAPNAPEPYHRRAAVLALAGRGTEAIAALREGLTHGLSPALVARDEDLTSLRESREFQELVKTKP